MKFENSLYRPNASGRLASSVFSKNKAGYYEKMFTSPSQPRTSYQMLIRMMFAFLTRKWGQLADVVGWNTLAATYFPKLSGFNVFCELNRNLQDVGVAIITTAPTTLTYPDYFTPASTSVEVKTTPGSEDIKLSFAPAIPVGIKVKLFAGAVVKPNTKPNYRNMTMIGVLDSTFLTGGSIMAKYLAKYPMPQTGDQVIFGIKPIDGSTGVAGFMQDLSAVAAV